MTQPTMPSPGSNFRRGSSRLPGEAGLGVQAILGRGPFLQPDADHVESQSRAHELGEPQQHVAQPQAAGQQWPASTRLCCSAARCTTPS